MSKFHKILLLLIGTITLLANPARSQSVGIVLSGGGAKGLYHVGMLKALEENGIPIDYVSGASMGAIVGAMYCSGYSPDEMISFFVTDSVQTWLSGKIPEQYSYYFKKFEPTPEMVSVNINPDSTKFNMVQLPTNVISPYRIDLAFTSMLQPASWAAKQNFDSLMVPFRCVASDVYNKKLVTFKSGCMPFAVRASMTIPFVFTPLSLDSVLLYDGGVYNNFPYQTLQEDFKPDVLIGGICSGNNENPSQNDLIGQVMVLVMGATNYELPDSTDITIARRFPEVSMLDYKKAAYIMARGYEDAMRMMPQLKKQITRRISPAEVQAKRDAFKHKIKPLLFEQITVEGLKPAQKDYVMRQLGVEEYQIVTPEYFEEKYMRILATGLFTGEFPQVTLNPATGHYIMKIRMTTKPSLKISVGGNLSSSSMNQSYLGLDFKTIGRAASNFYLRGYFGTYFSAGVIGGRHDMYTQFPFYIEYRYGFESYNHNTPMANGYYHNRDFRYEREYHNYLAAYWAVPIFGNMAFRTSLNLGVSNNTYYTGLHTSADQADESMFTYGSVKAELQGRLMNFTLYPSLGFNRQFSLKYTMGLEKFTPGTLSADQEAFRGRNRQYWEARFQNERIYEISRWFNLGYSIEAVVSNTPSFATSLMTEIIMPTFSPTIHSSMLFMPEFRSPSYVGVGVMPVINFLKNNNFYLRLYAYGFVPQEMFWDNGWVTPTAKRANEMIKGIFGGDLVYQTPVGPVSVTAVKYTTGPKNWAVVWNFGYTLFGTRRY